MKTSLRYFLTAGLLLAATGLCDAEPAGDGTAALRAALRDSMLQLRTAQSDLAAAQSAQVSFAAERKQLADQNELLKKQLTADRGTAEKAVATLGAQNAEQKALIARLNDALQQWKAEAEKQTQAAHTTETGVAKLQADNLVLDRRLADREAKNLQLFLLGNEILSRYEEFSLGNALRAKEPFVGRSRTKLENLVQDYQDKLADQRVKP